MNTNMERAMDCYRAAGETLSEGSTRVFECVCGGITYWCKMKINQIKGLSYAVVYTTEAALSVAEGTAIVAKEVGKYGLNKTKEVIEKTAEYKAGRKA